jgi:tetratricopeptide (TPR) repeat protein
VPAARLMALNQRVLDALTAREGSGADGGSTGSAGSGAADVSQIVHHAALAGDVDAIVRYGPTAARDAARAGAHREAVAHFTLVLDHAECFPARERARLYELHGIECYTVGASARCVESMRRAVALNRSLDDPRALGASLRWLSRMYWWDGDREHAEQVGREAVEVLERAGDDRLLALALSNQAQLAMLAQRAAESIG